MHKYVNLIFNLGSSLPKDACRIHLTKSCRSLFFVDLYIMIIHLKNRLRYSRERASQSLEVIQFIFQCTPYEGLAVRVLLAGPLGNRRASAAEPGAGGHAARPARHAAEVGAAAAVPVAEDQRVLRVRPAGGAADLWWDRCHLESGQTSH